LLATFTFHHRGLNDTPVTSKDVQDDLNSSLSLWSYDMCGIHASISSGGFQVPRAELKRLLCNRGPDHVGDTRAEIESHGTTYNLSFTSTVLALRGGRLTAQPFVDPQSGSVLCWNGEGWKIGPETIAGNDGQKIFDALLKASTTQSSVSESNRHVFKVLNCIFGPFAFVFLDNTHKQLFFGRDRLGRRSLLYNNLEDPDTIEFSSVADSTRGFWKEVEADGIYMLSYCSERNMEAMQQSVPSSVSSSILSVRKYPWEVNSGYSREVLQPLPRQLQETPL
jgi:asparagine synthetase B (glutamine-hydrolysing)